MMMSRLPSVVAGLLFHFNGPITAFQLPPSRRLTSKGSLTLSSYLDSLSYHVDQPPPSWSPPPIPAISSSSSETGSSDHDSNDISFYHAPLTYFDISKLDPNGPRKNADVGTPHDFTRELVDLGVACVGSWFCTAGGWPSPNQRGTTEVMYVLEGNGCLTDVDGMKHYFGPGDTVILPKGWSGRWDVLKDIKKIWFVHEHPNIEELSNPIRAVINGYHTLTSMEMQESHGVYKMSARGNPEIYSQQIYSVGPTKVGSWVCTPGALNIENLNSNLGFHVLEGVVYIIDAESEMGQSRKCMAGDTVLLPQGWNGSLEVVETVKKLWTTMDA